MAGYNAEQQQQQQQPTSFGMNIHLPLTFAFESLTAMKFTESGPRLTGVRGGVEVADKRQRRMIKNRESAARSRARKQAYSSQQQVEIKELQKENELLTKAIKVLATKVAPKMTGDGKPSLKRSFSGPL